MARPYGLVIYAATIPRAKSIQPSAAAPSRPRFLNLLYQFKGQTMQNDKKTTIWNILGACILGAILGALFAYGFLGGF
jgi:hypothetical protein